MWNPFSKKDDNQANERAFLHDENIYTGQTHPQATDEQIFLEQKKEQADLVKWQQNLRPEAIQFLHDIKREILVQGDIDKGTDTWERIPGSSPMANDLFIVDLISYARPYLSKNLMMSNYTEDRILRNLKGTLWSLRVHLLQNRQKYDIHKTDMEYIVRLFKNFIDATPFRSLQQGERKWLGTINKRIETVSNQPLPKKKGLFGMGQDS